MFNNPAKLPLSAPDEFDIVASDMAITDGVELHWPVHDASVSYAVKYGSHSGKYDITLTSDAESPFVIKDLTGGTYYFMVTATRGGVSKDAKSELVLKIDPRLKSIGTTNLYPSDDISWTFGNGQDIFFAAATDIGTKLFRYNGAEVTQISNTNPAGSDSPSDPIAFGSGICFWAVDAHNLTKLHCWDGTHTSEVSDTCPSCSDGSVGFSMTVVGSSLYFASRATATNIKVFRYDGAAVAQAADVRPGFTDGVSKLLTVGSDLVFVAVNATGVGETSLYQLSGTTLTEIASGVDNGGSPGYDIKVRNNVLYWSGCAAYGTGICFMKLWYWTALGGRQTFGYFSPFWSQYITYAPPYIYMSCTHGDSPNQNGLCQVPIGGTGGGKVSTINGWSGSDNVNEVAAVGSEIYFTASNAGELRVWHWTGAGQTALPDSNTSGNDSATTLTPALGALYYIASNGVGPKLFRWDGISVTQITNINPTGTDTIANLVAQGTKLYFTARNGQGQQGLYTYDGSALETIPVNLIRKGNDSPVSSITITSAGTSVQYFSAATNSSGTTKAFRYDGQNLVQISNTFALGSDNAQNFTAVGSDVYFTASVSLSSRKVFLYRNGVVTMPFAVNAAGTDNPANLIQHGGALYFSATANGSQTKLYRWDGSAVTQISNTWAANSDSPTGLVSVGSDLLFGAVKAPGVYKIFRYDGSAVTQVSNTYAAGSDVMSAQSARVGNTIYIALLDATAHQKLYSWSSAAGLVQVSDINSGAPDVIGGFGNNPMVAVGDDVYFVATSLDKLYRAHGTTVTRITDLRPGLTDRITNLVSFQNTLFFKSSVLTTVYRYDGQTLSTMTLATPGALINSGVDVFVPATDTDSLRYMYHWNGTDFVRALETPIGSAAYIDSAFSLNGVNFWSYHPSTRQGGIYRYQ